LFFSISNKKSSSIGKTVLALITPLICCNCFSRADEETINFIIISLVGKYIKLTGLKIQGIYQDLRFLLFNASLLAIVLLQPLKMR
jgi:hypothetical protein